MKIFNSKHSKTRIVGGTVDVTPVLFNPNDELHGFNDPLLYTVNQQLHYYLKVQICLLCCIWVTVWSAEVELTDEAMDAVNKRAQDLADTLSCTGL